MSLHTPAKISAADKSRAASVPAPKSPAASLFTYTILSSRLSKRKASPESWKNLSDDFLKLAYVYQKKLWRTTDHQANISTMITVSVP